MLIALPALADERCDAIFRDETGIVTNPAIVEAAAQRLMNRGVVVRVRVFDAHGQTLDQLAYDMRANCASVRADRPNTWRFTLVLLAFTPERLQKGIYFGASNERQLGGGEWRNLLVANFVPHQAVVRHHRIPEGCSVVVDVSLDG